MPEAAKSFAESSALRQAMVDCQVRPFDVTDQAVLGAMLAIPREVFAGAANQAICYSDAILTVKGESATRRLLAPMVLARLAQNAGLTDSSRVLDVGGGPGYSAAILASLAGHVVALEADAGFSGAAKSAFAALGLTNAEAVTGSLDRGAPEKGPFDVILVNGAVEGGLEGLFACLAPGGRLLAIQRAPGHGGLAGRAVCYTETGGKTGSRRLFDAAAEVLAPFAAKPAFAF